MTTHRKLKLYSDKSFLLPGQRHAQILFPFWGVVQKPWIGPQLPRYNKWSEIGGQWFEMSSLEDCDLAVVPAEDGDWSAMQEGALRFIAQAHQAGKPCVLFFIGDSAEPIEVPDCHVFRTSLEQGKTHPLEYAIPAWSEDFVSEYWDAMLPVREKSERPVVGFCGQPGPFHPIQRVKLWPRRMLHSVLSLFGPSEKKRGIQQRRREEGSFPGLDPSHIRAMACRALLKSDRVTANFQFGKGYFDLRSDEKQMQARQDLLKNIRESDYILCARGQGNFSYRLYETLCSGRIPVFINTDCVLPFQDQLDWKSFCVWIEADEVKNIGQIIADFHAALTPEAFVDMQETCRRVWVEWLSPEGFFQKFAQWFIEKK